MIYLIACKETNTCKIGYSLNPEKRLNQLQTANPFPIELVGVLKGTVKEEKDLHFKFQHYKKQGEWEQVQQLYQEDLKNC